jgi:hypothetical protein
MASEKISFLLNVPVSLVLRSIEGEPAESQFGPMQHKFQSDKGPFWVSEAAGFAITDQLSKLGVEAGQTVEICKAEVAVGRGQKSVRWVVTVPVGEQPDGTFVAPKAPAKAAAPKPAAAALAGDSGELEGPLWASVLLAQTNHVVDAYASALRHAGEKHGNLVKGDDVRSILLSVFINLSKKQEGMTRAA